MGFLCMWEWLGVGCRSPLIDFEEKRRGRNKAFLFTLSRPPPFLLEYFNPPACYFPLSFPDYDDALQEEEARELREIMEELQRVREEERRRNPEPAAVR